MHTIVSSVILHSLMFSFFTLLPGAQAVDPPPDGGYPNANTAEGDQALYSLTSGADNTAVGFNALFSDTTGSNNTSSGFIRSLITRPAALTQHTANLRSKVMGPARTT